ITGTMALTDPLVIDGEFTGLLVGAEASLDMTYEIGDMGCGGSFTGSAIIDAGGATASGSMDVVEDGCGGSPNAITMTLTRN
ncbi:MAG: hypothetical protein MJB57_02590, partial [Gemmatimonadetes bacterium]|nr:hypothetical protein [Gemmatimonadota bacterium]